MLTLLLEDTFKVSYVPLLKLNRYCYDYYNDDDDD